MSKNKRFLVGLAAAGIVGGATFGFAASLGGATSTNVGADDAVVASCDTNGIGVSYVTAYNATDAVYDITGVELAGVADECHGQTIDITLSGATVDGVTPSISTGTASFDKGGAEPTLVDVAAVDAELVKGFHVVIAGAIPAP